MKTSKQTPTFIFLMLAIFAVQATPTNIIGFGNGQPYEISTVAATKETDNITLQYISTPNNPNEFELLLSIGNLDTEDLMFMVLDSEKRVVKTSRVENDETVINLSNLASGTYFLIVSNDQSSKTFKIVKNTVSNSVIAMGK